MRWQQSLKSALAKYFHIYVFREPHLPVGIDLYRDIRKIAKTPIRTIFDVGANDGKTVLQFRKEFPEAQIYAFEPVAATYQKCLKNTRQLDNYQLEQMALSDKAGRQSVSLFPEKLSQLNSLSPKAMNKESDAPQEEITTITLDTYKKQKEIARINLLKLDVEAWEIAVLKGAKKALQEQKIDMIYCEVGFDKSDPRFTFFNNLQEFLEAYSYSFYGLYYTMTYQGKAHCSNALFVRKSDIKS